LVFLAACGGGEESAPPVNAPSAPSPVAVAPAASASAPKASPYPEAPVKPVVDEYFGTKVTDDYRWMEDGKDPKVIAWTEAENRLTHARLDALVDRPKIRARVAVHERDAARGPVR